MERLPRPKLVDGLLSRQVLMRVLRAARSHRTTGHAAEMAFFAVLTLVPSTIAVGSALGLSKRILGADAVTEAEDAAVEAVRVLMGPDLADSVIGPFVHAQLAQPKGGVAVGFLLVAWWLSSHLFESTGHALDSCYGVEDERPTFLHRLLALAFALVSVVLVSVTVEMMVVGPLGSADSGPVKWLGVGDAYTVVWSILRWPLLLLLVVGFLVCLYRFAPNVKHGWRDCLPGALLGATLWIAAAVAFRVSAAMGLRSSGGVSSDDPAIHIIGQSVNAVVGTVLWAYLASIAILVGGEYNAARREVRAAQAMAPADGAKRFQRPLDEPAAAAQAPGAMRPVS